MEANQKKDEVTKTPENLVPDFKADEAKANEAWNQERDIVSGVNKKIEKKLEKGNLKPEDIQNLGD